MMLLVFLDCLKVRKSADQSHLAVKYRCLKKNLKSEEKLQKMSQSKLRILLSWFGS